MKAKGKLLYFRSKAKSAYALRFNNGVKIRQLQSLLSKRESILLENIIMIHKGKVVDSSLHLQTIIDNGIIHVIDLAQVKKDNVKFHLKGLDGCTHTHNVRAQMKVKDFIKQNLHKIDKIPYFYIGLVYVGKLLSPDRSFFQEFVEQDCQIIVVSILDYANKRKIDRGIKRDASEDRELILLKAAKQQANKNEEINDNGKEDVAQLSSPAFKIQVSQVDSVDSNEQRNQVQFYEEEDPFNTKQQQQEQQLPPQAQRQKLGESPLLATDFIIADSAHVSQTKSFIQNLMKKYKIMFQ